MSTNLECWACGGSLHDVPRPIRRLSRCSACRADLHACRLCRHYTPGIRGECDHDRAERVLDKTGANFCTHFRPRPGAHAPPANREAERARAELETLFGAQPPVPEAGREPPAGAPAPAEAAQRARRALESLFDLDECAPGPAGQRDDEAPTR